MALYWLVQGCQAGDSLVFHYSGHGSQQRNYTGDEVDGYDETLCPVDFKTQGMIVDDEINDTIVRPLPPGVKLHAIIDACHSGTVLDLPFLCRMDRWVIFLLCVDVIITQNIMLHSFSKTIIQCGKTLAFQCPFLLTHFLYVSVFECGCRSGRYVWEDHRPRSGTWKGTNGGEAISFSGCDDDQTSADTSVKFQASI